MKIITGSANLKKRFPHPVLTLGNFDGMHIGHRKLIEKTSTIAKKKNGTSILFTFDPHPVALLAPDLKPSILQTREQKIEIAKMLGLDLFIIEPFTKKLASLTAKDFFNSVILKKIGAKEIVVGYDFTFGQRRGGQINDLAKMSKENGIILHIVDAVFVKDSLVSSTHIRHFVENGNMEMAAVMLGRNYAIRGIVIKGRGVGSTLGFHTANLKPDNELIPPTGVYITRTKVLSDGKIYSSVTNAGFNPTFGGRDLSVETHLLDFDGSLLKKHIEVKFLKKIRREMTFESPEDLRRQIVEDVKTARRYHEKRI